MQHLQTACQFSYSLTDKIEQAVFISSEDQVIQEAVRQGEELNKKGELLLPCFKKEV